MKTNLLHAALFTPRSDGGWGLPLLLIGQPGTSKTSVFRQLGEKLGCHVEVLSPGERGEGAFGVTPVPVQTPNGTVLDYPAPSWTMDLIDKNGDEVGIVLIDEINTAPPALQPALMGAVLDKRIGGKTLGKRVRVMAAMNPVGHAAAGWDLSAPVANRFGHIEWHAPEADGWTSWLLGGSVVVESTPIGAEEKRVMAEWPAAWAKAAGLVSAFIRRRPELLHKMPDDNDPAQSRAWPSPRTWEFATRALAASTVHNLTDIESDELISAFIGTDAAGEFIAWCADQDLPDAADLLDGKVRWKHDVTRLDRTDAVLGSCAAVVTNKETTSKKRIAALWSLIDVTMADAKDIVIPTAMALNSAGLSSTPEAAKVLNKLHGILEASK